MTDTNSPVPSIPVGSLVLVTGANGFIASSIVREFLERGYRVRGTVRDVKKNSWMSEKLFPNEAALGKFELCEVPDLTADHAFDKALVDVSAVVHVASAMNLQADAQKMISETVAGTMGVVRAAAKTPSVKQFVYTSTTATLLGYETGTPFYVTQDTWNERDPVKALEWDNTTGHSQQESMEQGVVVYAASKTEAERALWKFVKESKPHFQVNSVLPGAVLGRPTYEGQLHGSPGFIPALYRGEVPVVMSVVMEELCYVHVKDCAALHVAAALDPDTNGQRLLAYHEPVTMNTILRACRRLFPDRRFIEDLPNQPESVATKDDALQLALLEKWAGRESWISFDETVLANLEEPEVKVSS